MTAAALLLLAAALLVASPSRVSWMPVPPTARTLRPRTKRTDVPTAVTPTARQRAVRVVLTAAMGVLLAAVLRSVMGLVLGAGLAYVVWRLLGRSARKTPGLGTAVAPVLDLGVLLLRSGAPATSAFAEATAVGNDRLRAIGKQIRALESMGQRPETQWATLLDDPTLRRVAQAAMRSAHSGAALADAWSAIAVAERATSTARAEAAARRAGVQALGPLGLCFLPAFIALAVVPMVIGLLSDVLG